jgi:hypothetical protein
LTFSLKTLKFSFVAAATQTSLDQQSTENHDANENSTLGVRAESLLSHHARVTFHPGQGSAAINQDG